MQIFQNDPFLLPYKEIIIKRAENARKKQQKLLQNKSLKDFATGHLYFGLHKTQSGWVFREWAPNASEVFLVGDFSNWQILPEYAMQKLENGNWEIHLSENSIKHLQQYKILIKWTGGEAYRLPSYGNYMVQDETSKLFNACVWSPESKFNWKHEQPKKVAEPLLIYEAHVGMSSCDEKVATYLEFAENVLPRIKKLGYNAIQLMAIQEHPYYGSFGYHVSNFFAVSSRFGTPDELKMLIDKAHGLGLRVIMDLVHSHAVKNENEGLGKFDGSDYQYFHTGTRRLHAAWDSLCFNYAKPEVLHFLLSNCHYWLAEFKFDGFRFDGVTSMLYLDHGLNRDFVNYSLYYDGNQDEDALDYLVLANKLIHEINPQAITIAEEMSGMPGLCLKPEAGGYGFDYRLAMGVPDYWIKLIKTLPDEQWNVGNIYYELKSHRADEKTISYAESHDQALVGDKTLFFRLTDPEIYTGMSKSVQSIVIERGMALHKMIRLITIATAGAGYLTFMGNEFGHPEWIDFPRQGNGWSHKYARRQWNLADDNLLKYHFLQDFDETMIQFIKQSDIYTETFPEDIATDEQKQVLIFKRGGLIFVFNFSPNNSYTDYRINLDPGNYQVIFDTDDVQFGGLGRIDKNYVYMTASTSRIKTIVPIGQHFIRIYVPARTGMVLRQIK